jgi:hypothetical protein
MLLAMEHSPPGAKVLRRLLLSRVPRFHLPVLPAVWRLVVHQAATEKQRQITTMTLRATKHTTKVTGTRLA